MTGRGPVPYLRPRAARDEESRLLAYHVLSITKDLGFTKSVICPVVIESEDGPILFDAGYPGQYDEFELAFRDIGLSISDLRAIVLSHHDHDHIGS